MKFETKFRFVHFLVFLHCWLYSHLVTCLDAGTITMVSVRVNSLDEMAGTGKFVHLCGGSLITTSVVFTGCSCISKKSPVEKGTEDKDKVELLAADQVQVHAGIAATTKDKDAASQTSMALALNIHALCDANFAYNYGMIKLQNSFRLVNGLQLSRVLSLDMSDFEKKMMNMTAGDCWTETWILKEGGGELIDRETTRKPPEFTEITEKSEGTITEFTETKVAEVGTHSGEDATDDEIYEESGSYDHDGSASADYSQDYGEETLQPGYTSTHPSGRPGIATAQPSGKNATTQKPKGANATTTGTRNTTTRFNLTTVSPSNVTTHDGASHMTSVVPRNETNPINTNTTTNVTNGTVGGAPATATSTNGTNPKAPPKMAGRRRRNLYSGENIEESGLVKLKIEEPVYMDESKLWKREEAPPETPVGPQRIPVGTNITEGSAKASQPGALPVGSNGTEGVKGNVSTEVKPKAPNGTFTGSDQLVPITTGKPLDSNGTITANVSKILPQNVSALIPSVTVSSNGSATDNVTVKPVTTEGRGTEHFDYSGDYEEDSGTEKDGESYITEEIEPGESEEGSATSDIEAEPQDGLTDETPQPVEHDTGLPRDSTPGSEPHATLDKTKPQRVTHLKVDFLDWKECTSMVCPDPTVTCDSDNMDTKWCLSSTKPDVRLCDADTGAPVYCKSSMVAILSNVNLECPKTATKGVAVGMEGAFEYLKAIMGMPDFKKKVPPVPPARARKASAPKIHVPINIITMTGFLLALLHI